MPRNFFLWQDIFSSDMKFLSVTRNIFLWQEVYFGKCPKFSRFLIMTPPLRTNNSKQRTPNCQRCCPGWGLCKILVLFIIDACWENQYWIKLQNIENTKYSLKVWRQLFVFRSERSSMSRQWICQICQDYHIATLRLHLGFSAKLRIWQVLAWME